MPSDPISREQVLHVARLARLALDEAEIDRMTRELADILRYVESLEQLDTSGVEPTAQVGLEALPLREDVAASGLSHDQALEQSPRSAHGGFMVPGFVEE
jgi:aspartyl-tRNA(Asn)/glutamyl-tRNA(Gln) amidotransferase subunit C